MSLLENLPHKVTIQTRAVTEDAVLGDSETFSNTKTNVKAWGQTASQQDIVLFAQRGFVVTHRVYFSTNEALTEANRILYGSKKLDFRSYADASAGAGILYKVMCEEVTPRKQ